jgi:hypothetical protein
VFSYSSLPRKLVSKLPTNKQSGAGELKRYWSWRNGVNKIPPLLHFPIAKGGTKTIAHLPITEGLSFPSLDMRIYNCKLRNEKII